MQQLKVLFFKYKAPILYLVFGVSTTIVNIVVYGLMGLTGAPYLVSYVVAWFWAVLFAYLTNRVWVFNSTAQGFKHIAAEIVQFFLARILTGVIGAGILAFGVQFLHQNDFIWNIIQNVFVILSNYVLSKLIIFRNKEKMTEAYERNSNKD